MGNYWKWLGGDLEDRFFMETAGGGSFGPHHSFRGPTWMNAQSIAKNIEMLYKNKKSRTSFSQILSTKDYGNEDEILKFYEMIKN